MIELAPTHKHWLDQNFTSVNDYFFGWVDKYSRGGLWTDREQPLQGTVRAEFMQNPGLGKAVVADWKTNTENIEIHQERLLNRIKSPETYVILVTGIGGSGKGTSVWWILDKLKDEFNVKVVMPIASDAQALPKWADRIPNIMDMADGDIILYDEAGIRSNARRSMSKENENATAWLPVGRHSGATVIYITQYASMADKNISRFTHVHINKGFSAGTFGQDGGMERSAIADNPILKYFKESQEQPDYARVPSTKKDWAIINGGGTYLAYLPMPAFYTDTLSKPISKYIDKAGGDHQKAEDIAMNDAQQMLDDGLKAEIIEVETRIRGFKRSRIFWRKFTGEDKTRGGDDDWR